MRGRDPDMIQERVARMSELPDTWDAIDLRRTGSQALGPQSLLDLWLAGELGGRHSRAAVGSIIHSAGLIGCAT